MSYKPSSKEEALQEFGREIIKALKKTSPESRKYTVGVFRDIKDRNLLRKAPSYEESALFEYMNKLHFDNDPIVKEAGRLYGDIIDSMINYLNPYLEYLEPDDTKILRKIDVESILLEDYSVVVDYFEYGMKERERKKFQTDENDFNSK